MPSESYLLPFFTQALGSVIDALESMTTDGMIDYYAVWVDQYNFLIDIANLAISDKLKLFYIYHSMQYLTLCHAPAGCESERLRDACSILGLRFKSYSTKSYLNFSKETLAIDVLEHFHPSHQWTAYSMSQLRLSWADEKAIQLSRENLDDIPRLLYRVNGDSSLASLVLEDFLERECVRRDVVETIGSEILPQTMLVNYKLRPDPLSYDDYKLSETEFLASSRWGCLVWMLLPDEIEVLREQPIFFKLTLMTVHAILTFGVVRYVELLMLSTSISLPALSDGALDTLLDADNTPKALMLRGRGAPRISRCFSVSCSELIHSFLARPRTPLQKKARDVIRFGNAGSVQRKLDMSSGHKAPLAIEGVAKENVLIGLKPILSWLHDVGKARQWYIKTILQKSLITSQAGRRLLVEYQAALSVSRVPQGDFMITDVVFPRYLNMFCDLCTIPRFEELIPRLPGQLEDDAFENLTQALKSSGANKLGLHIFEQLWRRRYQCFFDVPEDIRRKVGKTVLEINMALIACLVFFPKKALDEFLWDGLNGQRLRRLGRDAKASGRLYYCLIVAVDIAIKYTKYVHSSIRVSLKQYGSCQQKVKNDLLEKRLDRVMNRLLKLRREVSYQRGFSETCNRMPTREMDAINFSVRMFKKNFSRYSLLEKEKQLQAFEAQVQALSVRMKRSEI